MTMRIPRLPTLLAASLVFGVLLLANPRPAHAIGGEPGRSTLGVGLIVGAPTGLSLELRLGSHTALDLAVGFDQYEHNDYYVHFDYLVYLVDLSRGGSLSVPFYLGIGMVLWDGHYEDRPDHEDDLRLGVRVPFGLAIAFRRAPVQFFLEGAVRILFFDDREDRDYDRVDLTGGGGFRVYF